MHYQIYCVKAWKVEQFLNMNNVRPEEIISLQYQSSEIPDNCLIVLYLSKTKQIKMP